MYCLQKIIVKNKTVSVLIIAFAVFVFAWVVALTPTPRYSLDFGMDFATGKGVVRKYIGTRTGKPAWIKYSDNPLREDIMRKYHLGYKKPILQFYYITYWRFSWFSYDPGRYGKKFWKWRYYIFCRRPLEHGDGYCPYLTFFRIVRKFSPPADQVKEMYAECIRIYESKTDVSKRTREYLEERYEYYYAPKLKKVIEKLFKTGERKLYMNADPKYIARYLIRHRNNYPDQLPDIFLRLAIEQNIYTRLELDSTKGNSFLLKEFILHPTRKNALYLALEMTLRYVGGIRLDTEFRKLHEAGCLKQFVKMVMPGKPVGKLPDPCPGRTRRRNSIYYEDTYKDLPERNAALQMTFNSKLLRTYWKSELKKLQ